MSGGAMNYLYYHIDEAARYFEDSEIRDLLIDLSKVVHDLEWYLSSDIGKETYLKTVAGFKKKWFKDDRSERLKGYIDQSLKEVKSDLYHMIGDNE